MAEHAHSTPAPAVDPHSPDRSAATLWRLYLQSHAALSSQSERLEDDAFDALGAGVDSLFGAALTAPIVTSADAVSRVELTRNLIIDGNEWGPPHLAALDALATWIRTSGREVDPAPRPDRLTYIARLYAHLVDEKNRLDREICAAPKDEITTAQDGQISFIDRWMDAVEEEAVYSHPVNDEGAAFLAANISALTEIVAAVQTGDPDGLATIGNMNRIESMADALLNYLDPNAKLEARHHLATFSRRLEVHASIGGLGPDGRVRLDAAA